MISALRPIFETLVRHGANAIGVWLISTGLFDAAQVEILIGAVVILASAGWSIVNGLRAKKIR